MKILSGDTVDEDGVSALMMAATEGGAEACEARMCRSTSFFDVNNRSQGLDPKKMGQWSFWCCQELPNW